MIGIRRPKDRLLGADFAGTVESVGSDVTAFRPGDDVFGVRGGAFAEYVCVKEALALKPPALSFEEAAAVPIAGLTALQGLRDKAGLQSGQRALINGASGGVGTFAVQIAVGLGAEVTAVCSAANVDVAASLGATRVVDYAKEDFTRLSEPHDVLLDIAGSRSWPAMRRILQPDATLVIVGGPRGRLLGPLGHIAAVRTAGIRSSRKIVFFIAKPSAADLDSLREMLQSGQVRPVIDRRYALDEVADALSYLGEGHARGKVVITI
jgi:NADPH:quinone reductase-like Zn-dependent oxidoreductase